MSALTNFPLQYIRQDAVPVDIDITFATTADRMAYLTNARRYASMIVGDTETQSGWILNAARDTWLPLGSGGGVGYIPKWAEWPIDCIVNASGFTVPNTAGVVAPTHDYLKALTAAVTGLGTLSFVSGSPNTYKFQPETGGLTIFYRFSFSFKVTISQVATKPMICLVGKDSGSGSLTSGVLFRKDIVPVAGNDGFFYCDFTFEYLHLNSYNPIYLYFVDNSI